ncbi:MAG: GNAT family N-acetyltransferase [Magnetococcales bacterium]|nr:GNAT family N-acetyltransferase [Magnetococcales bacterium]
MPRPHFTPHFSNQHQRAAQFLRQQNYPHPWSTFALSRYAILTEIRNTDEKIVGYIWGTWDNESPDMLCAHACFQPEYRGCWMTKSTISLLFKTAQKLGARSIRLDPGSHSLHLFHRLLRRFGFSLHDTYLLKNLE